MRFHIRFGEIRPDESVEVSSEPWEIKYLHDQFPTYPEAEIIRALNDCKQELENSEDREEILKCVRRKLA